MLGLCLLLGGIASSAQTTTFPDPAVPVALVPSLFDSTVYALNQDGTVKEYATEGALNLGYTCPAAPGLAAPGATPNTLAFDGDLYEVGPVTGGGGYGVVGITPPTATGCKYSPVAAIPGSPTSVVAAAGDARHHRLVVLTQDGGNTADKITGFSTGGFFFPPNGALTSLGQASLDQGAQYTALLTDFDGVGDTVVTEFSTPSSPGNLWIYNPASGTAIKVLGPGGVSLPAINAFIIHNPNNLGGGLLVLANQDGLTPANISAPPLDPTPFSIIDLGKLHLLIASLPAGSTSVTVPVITTISATVPYYAMLGAAYNPVNNLLYAVVGSGTDITAVTRTILSYDPTNPAAPAETVVTDVSSIPIFPPVYQQLGFGAATGILQLGLSAGSGTMQFFLPGPNEVYSVGIAAGAANTVSQITGASFPNDSTFKPTAMVENSLVGNTYLASQSGNVDTLTPLPGALHNAYIDLTGSLVQAAVGQDQTVGLFAYFPEVSDTNLGATQITVTAFPEDPIGPSFTFAMDPSTDARGGTQVQGTFLQPGLYALVASFPGDGYFAPARSQPVNVWVAEEIPTQLLLTATSLTPTSGLAKIFLTGSTYTPTGTITVKDFTTGLPLGTFQLTGTLQNPISVNITLAPGTTMVQASYSGDAANQPSISSPVTLTGAVAPIATKLSITGPATAVAGSSFNTLVTMQLASQSANTPTGNIVVTAQLAGGAAIPLTTVTPAQAIAAGGITVATSLPSAGAWTVTATYAGDANFAASTNSFNETVTAAALQATSDSGHRLQCGYFPQCHRRIYDAADRQSRGDCPAARRRTRHSCDDHRGAGPGGRGSHCCGDPANRRNVHTERELRRRHTLRSVSQHRDSDGRSDHSRNYAGPQRSDVTECWRALYFDRNAVDARHPDYAADRERYSHGYSDRWRGGYYPGDNHSRAGTGERRISGTSNSAIRRELHCRGQLCRGH
jgi:hypothetical protein